MIELAPPRGRIVVVGVCMEEDRLRPRMAIRKELSFRFVLAYTRADFARVLQHVEAGEIRAADFVTDVIGLDALPDAFEALRRPGTQVKVLVDPAR
jgi:threonine dehydrogenase-like Zn-dependent dehydrogenase